MNWLYSASLMKGIRMLAIFNTACVSAASGCLIALIAEEPPDCRDLLDADCIIPLTLALGILAHWCYSLNCARYLRLREWHRQSASLDDFLVQDTDLRMPPLRLHWAWRVTGALTALGLIFFALVVGWGLVDTGDRLVHRLLVREGQPVLITIALWLLLISWLNAIPAVAFTVKTLFMTWVPPQGQDRA